MSTPDELLAEIDRKIADQPGHWALRGLLLRCRTSIAANAALAARGVDAKRLVDQQAEDEGLWFIAVTASEAYLQQALRALHAAIEVP